LLKEIRNATRRIGRKLRGSEAGISGLRDPGDRNVGRGERIRTSGPRLPKTVLYQAELLPDRSHSHVTAEASGV
jgi:hypothetical protein